MNTIDGPTFQTMKVFDCQYGMPKDVKKAFFDLNECGNDVYVSWTVQDDDTDYYSNDEFAIKRRLVDDWLIANGADGRTEGKYKGETVLINHWW